MTVAFLRRYTVHNDDRLPKIKILGITQHQNKAARQPESGVILQVSQEAMDFAAANFHLNFLATSASFGITSASGYKISL